MENEFDSEQRICIVNVIQMMQGSMWCSTMGPCGSGLHGGSKQGHCGGQGHGVPRRVCGMPHRGLVGDL